MRNRSPTPSQLGQPDEGGHVEGHTAAEACFVGLQYRLHAEPAVWSATLGRVSKEIQPDGIEQFVDRWPQGQKIIDNAA
jgi:hypothetical protein